MSGSKGPTTGTGGDADDHLTEWQTARDLLVNCDNNLHDLRKYGFTFLTALIAAESILLPSGITPSGSTGISDNVKLGVFVVTLLLIYVLHLIDENYQVLEDATATRALVLERELDIELTEVITDRFETDSVRTRAFLVYALFAVGVAVLGTAVFYPNASYIFALVVFLCVAVAGLYLTRRALRLRFKFTPGRVKGAGGRDWTVEPLECKEGDLVRITLNNFGKRDKKGLPAPIVFGAGSPIWQIEDQQGNPKFVEVATEEVEVHENYIWLWDTHGAGTGVFQVHPHGRDLPLIRKVIISRGSSSAEAKSPPH